MKGIILHGGYGTRLGPLTLSGPKQLLKIANKPMSQFALEDIRNSGISEIAIVIGDVYPEKVQEYYGDGSKFGVQITYVFQDKPRGISHAIGLCKEFIGNEKFVVYLGDNIMRKDLNEFVERFSSSSHDCMILLSEVNDPSRFGIAEFTDNKISKIIEKPKNTNSNLAVIGIYFFTEKIFQIIEKLKPSQRGELEITDAIQIMLEEGYDVDYKRVTGWWKDTGTPEDIIHANELILDNLDNYNYSSVNGSIQGKVLIGKNSSLSKDCSIFGPVMIGDDCEIGPNVRLGPNTSIGNKVVLKKCEIRNSIILDDCKIEGEISLVNSIIAQNCEIIKDKKLQKNQLLLGEFSKLKL
jgi:glucose-1-phosphate thymidylyltransferase